jgi:hypothetical protein
MRSDLEMKESSRAEEQGVKMARVRPFRVEVMGGWEYVAAFG